MANPIIDKFKRAATKNYVEPSGKFGWLSPKSNEPTQVERIKKQKEREITDYLIDKNKPATYLVLNVEDENIRKKNGWAVSRGIIGTEQVYNEGKRNNERK